MSAPLLQRRHLLAAGLIGAVVPGFAARAADPPPRPAMARTRAGTLEGIEQGGIRRFLGVPYGRAPVGRLRFRPPEPAPGWTGTRQALTFAPEAIQSQPPSGAPPMSEDCLYLNIWAPAAPGPHPVFVWVHGGANVSGSASYPLFDGTPFARAGIICVNIAYRLGCWGFADMIGAGTNNGLRDILLALSWIRDNIAAFGGNPGRVTLAGQSAGAKNVTALLASPAAAGLFQRAIVQSGGGQTIHGRDGDRDLVGRMRRALAGLGTTAETASAVQLLTAQNRVINSFGRAYPFRSTIDGDLLPGRPLDAFAVAASSRVPLIVGSTRDESMIFMGSSRANLPIERREIANVPTAVVSEMERVYAQRYPTLDPLARRIRVLTAEEYWVPTMRLADTRVRAGGAPVYLYRYDVTPPTGPYVNWAVHGAELPHVWASPMRPPGPPLHMHTHWASFIRDGKPSAPNAPDWPAFTMQSPLMMRYLNDRSEIAAPDFAELRLWDGKL